jgi:hypothetical protein
MTSQQQRIGQGRAARRQASERRVDGGLSGHCTARRGGAGTSRSLRGHTKRPAVAPQATTRCRQHKGKPRPTGVPRALTSPLRRTPGSRVRSGAVIRKVSEFRTRPTRSSSVPSARSSPTRRRASSTSVTRASRSRPSPWWCRRSCPARPSAWARSGPPSRAPCLAALGLPCAPATLRAGAAPPQAELWFDDAL